MWYVIQTISGKEHEVCIWINTYVNKNFFNRCFVPLYEDVWRKDGIGHISIKKMFSGYLFLETSSPEMVYDALKKIPQMTILLAAEEKAGRVFLPIHKDEEVFFDSILSDGLMKVSYIHMGRNGKISRVIGPLQSHQEHIIRLDFPHRRAIVNIPILGETRRLKFGLWLDIDPKLPWIEEEKQKRIRDNWKDGICSENSWDWRAWKQHSKEKQKEKMKDEVTYGYKVGEYVINTTGIYGDTPLEVVEIRPGKNRIVVNVLMFGYMTRVEMGMEEIDVC